MNSIRTVWRTPSLPQSDVLCATAFVVAHAALLVAWPAVLAQDAPTWIAEGAQLRAFFQAPPADGCQLAAAVPPNAFSQVVIALLCFIMPVQLAGRLYIVTCIEIGRASCRERV